jgi:Transcriptional regulator/sugar kinase
VRTGSNLSSVAKYNENVVIHALRRLGPSSQGPIAEMSGLSVQTVSAILRGLGMRGLVTEVTTESVGRGRPRVIIDLVASARYAIGFHIDPALVTTVVLDMKGTVVASSSEEEVDLDHPEHTVDDLARRAAALVQGAGIDPDRVVGACVASPGPIEPVTQAPWHSVWMPAWTGFPIGKALGTRLGYAVPVVKDTLAAVIGENWVRGGESLDATMVFVYLGAGTGVGLSLNGEPVRGFSGNAGEVGAMLVAVGARDDRRAGGIDNDPAAVVSRAHTLGILDDATPGPWDRLGVDRDFRRLCAIAARDGGDAAELLHQAAVRIAEMVLMATELVDADMAVFGGPYWELVRPWYEPVAISTLAGPSARGPHPVGVYSTAMGADVGAIGAASVVLDRRYVPRAPRRARSVTGPSGT